MQDKDKPQSGAPADPPSPPRRTADGERIMKNGELFSVWSDRLVDQMVRNLNAKTSQDE